MKYRQGSWIELCNNDCGTEVYFDKEKNIVCNAAAVDKDCVHKDVCNEIKKLKIRARTFNWFPSYAIEGALVSVFLAADKIENAHQDWIDATNMLKRVIEEQRQLNKQAKADWEKEKITKLDAKKITDKAYGREQDQIEQWRIYEQKEAQFRTADRLQYTK